MIGTDEVTMVSGGGGRAGDASVLRLALHARTPASTGPLAELAHALATRGHRVTLFAPHAVAAGLGSVGWTRLAAAGVTVRREPHVPARPATPSGTLDAVLVAGALPPGATPDVTDTPGSARAAGARGGGGAERPLVVGVVLEGGEPPAGCDLLVGSVSRLAGAGIAADAPDVLAVDDPVGSDLDARRAWIAGVASADAYLVALLGVGRADETKRATVLLRSLLEAVPGTVLVVDGPAPLGDALARAFPDAAVALPTEDPRGALGACDAALVLGRDARACARTLEALGAGLPCASAVGPLLLASGGVQGIVLPVQPPASTAALVTALGQIYRPSPRRRQLSARLAAAIERRLVSPLARSSTDGAVPRSGDSSRGSTRTITTLSSTLPAGIYAWPAAISLSSPPSEPPPPPVPTPSVAMTHVEPSPPRPLAAAAAATLDGAALPSAPLAGAALDAPVAPGAAVHGDAVPAAAVRESALNDDAVDGPTLHGAPPDGDAVDRPAATAPADPGAMVDGTTVDDAAAGSAAVESAAVESAAVESAAVESQAIGSPAIGSPAIENLAIESAAIGSPAIENLAIESPATDGTAIESPGVEVGPQGLGLDAEDREEPLLPLLARLFAGRRDGVLEVGTEPALALHLRAGAVVGCARRDGDTDPQMTDPTVDAPAIAAALRAPGPFRFRAAPARGPLRPPVPVAQAVANALLERDADADVDVVGGAAMDAADEAAPHPGGSRPLGPAPHPRGAELLLSSDPYTCAAHLATEPRALLELVRRRGNRGRVIALSRLDAAAAATVLLRLEALGLIEARETGPVAPVCGLESLDDRRLPAKPLPRCDHRSGASAGTAADPATTARDAHTAGAEPPTMTPAATAAAATADATMTTRDAALTASDGALTASGDPASSGSAARPLSPVPPVVPESEVLRLRALAGKPRPTRPAAAPRRAAEEARSLCRRARAAADRGDLWPAVRWLRKAVELVPDDADTRLLLGELLAQNPRWIEAATKELLIAARLRPESAAPYRTLGVACRRAGDLAAAARWFARALAIDPGDDEARRELAEQAETSGGRGQLLRRLVRIVK